MLPKLCHLDNDLEIIIITYTVYILRSTQDPHTLPGDIFFSRYPSVALACNLNLISIIYQRTYINIYLFESQLKLQRFKLTLSRSFAD